MAVLVHQVLIELPPSTDLEGVKKAIREHLKKDEFSGKGFISDRLKLNKKTDKVEFELSGLCKYRPVIARFAETFKVLLKEPPTEVFIYKTTHNMQAEKDFNLEKILIDLKKKYAKIIKQVDI